MVIRPKKCCYVLDMLNFRRLDKFLVGAVNKTYWTMQTTLRTANWSSEMSAAFYRFQSELIVRFGSDFPESTTDPGQDHFREFVGFVLIGKVPTILKNLQLTAFEALV